MFARPQKVSPNCRYGQETDHTFTKIAIPLLEKSKFAQPEKNSSLDTPKSTSTTRTGDSLSYSTNANDHTHIPRICAQRMYRVVSYREDPKTGKKIIFDPLDGKMFVIGAGFVNRVSTNVVLFESKKGAMSERYPINQVGAAKSGNGHYPRVLIAFDAWGDVKRRYGGAPSLLVEFAKAMKIVEFLDPPHPVAKRLCDRYVEPFFYTPADRAPPNRMRSPKHFKLNRFFSLQSSASAPATATVSPQKHSKSS